MNQFHVQHQDPLTKARAGILKTPHGDIETPVFMPVGTQATVKTMDSSEIETMGYKIILGNTYHLFLRPGEDTLVNADSGGYQVFSLATRCKMSEQGVEFSSHVDGQRHWLTPEITTNFQFNIGSDIAMCLDDCPPYPTLKSDAKKSLDLTLRWAQRCKDTYADRFKETPGVKPLLFGITQGASFADLRKESIERMVEIDFPGYAIGGLGLGEDRAMTWEMAEASLDSMPDKAPHYMMGFGQPEDMWEGVERGVDMFDCVLPTRNGRNGQAVTSIGRINVTNARFKEDFSPLDPACPCPACKKYTRAYLCHLFRSGEMLAPRLVTLHNLWFMIGLLRTIRQSILQGQFHTAKREFFQRFDSEKTLLR
jgi:queuine tRNA-ribosyltransferase